MAQREPARSRARAVPRTLGLVALAIAVLSTLVVPTVPVTADPVSDLVNGAVSVPEHPDPLSFDPNAIKDIKAADPGAGINLIAPPGASSTGDAQLTYDLEVPPGREGMQPRLSVRYSSQSPNGWMGVGWDIPVSTIGIDTAFGAPRLSPTEETETYTLEGKQLAPVAHRSQLVARTPEKVFHTRVEGGFQKIVRHGSSPARYWWEVVDTDGTRSFYGGTPESNGPTPDGTLSAAGGIFRWMLRMVVDRNGNAIVYNWERVDNPEANGRVVPGSQLYLSSIEYTRSNESPGSYTVSFERTRDRSDIVTDARGGAKVVTAELLARVKVKFRDQLIRQYDFQYEDGAFGKKLLKSITQLGDDGKEALPPHVFTYFDEQRDNGNYKGFAAPVTVNTNDDGPNGTPLNLVDDPIPLFPGDQASALSGAVTSSGGGHLYVGYNQFLPSKQGSIGAKVGFSHSETETQLAHADLDGDGKADIVFKAGGQYFYRPNTSPLDGPTTYGDRVALPTLPAIGLEGTDTFSIGGEVHTLAVPVLANHAQTFATGRAYLTDRNADRFIDVVLDNVVYFNHLDANGVPTFTTDPNHTPVPITAGTVDSGKVVGNPEGDRDKALNEIPLLDTVRQWEAPWSGTVEITGDVRLVRDTSASRNAYPSADGVRVAIQHNASERWTTTIRADDYAVKTPSGVDAVSVGAGDKLFFRVGSRTDGAFDRVAWAPQIKYVGEPSVLDVNGLDLNRFQATDDFSLTGREGIHVRMPVDGRVQLTGTFTKTGTTTDDASFGLFLNDSRIFSHALPAWDETGDVRLIHEFEVKANDAVRLQVFVDSQVDVSKLQLTPHLSYLSSPTVPQPADGNAVPAIEIRPPYNLDTYPITVPQSRQQPWQAPAGGVVVINPAVLAGAGVTDSLTFTVKKRNALLAKRTITIVDGVVDAPSVTLAVAPGDALYFDFSSRSKALSDRLAGTGVALRYLRPGAPVVAAPSALHTAGSPGIASSPYRGWSYVGYKAGGERSTNPIPLSAFDLPADGKYDPEKDLGQPLSPSPQQNAWTADAPKPALDPRVNGGQPDRHSAQIAASEQSSSRLGGEPLLAPAPIGGTAVPAVSRVGRTQQTSLSASIFSATGGTSWSGVDSGDFNGDQYDDVWGNGHIQYTTPRGTLGPSVPQAKSPRDGADRSFNVGTGGNPAEFVASALGLVGAASKAAPKDNGTGGSQMVALGTVLSASLGYGDSSGHTEAADMNGDGLRELVTRTPPSLLDPGAATELSVRFNLGYGFSEPEIWSTAAWISQSTSTSASFGVSASVNVGNYEFAGGISGSKNESKNDASLFDVDGDGSADLVRIVDGQMKVAFNNGTGFGTPIDWHGADRIASSSTTGLGGGLYFTVPIPLCFAACWLILNPGGDGSRSMARQEAALMDLNFDGRFDFVTSTEDKTMMVSYNQHGRTHLLRSVARPLGATITLDYARAGNTVEDPHTRWVLSKVVTTDGHAGDGVDRLVTTYRYEGGRFDRLERVFYGFAKVIEEHRNAGNRDTIARTVEREFRNDTYYTQGLLAREVLKDKDGKPYTESVHTYVLRDVLTGAQPVDGKSTTATVFPMLDRVERRVHEGGAGTKSTFTTQKYDGLGNVRETFDAGDEGEDDDLLVAVTHTDCPDSYVMAVPETITVSSKGVRLRERQADVDCRTGKVRQVRQRLETGDTAITDLDYHGNGTLKRVVGPPNKNGERYEVSYEYDQPTATHVAKISDILGYTSSATTNLKFGAVESTTDVNGNHTSHIFDAIGRLRTITGPYEQGANRPTIEFRYNPKATVPWALTRHLDSHRSATDPIETVVFVDGLKRVLQTKKDSTVHVGDDEDAKDVMVVSGRVTFDHLGRIVEQFHPVTEPLGNAGTFNPARDGVTPTRLTHDALDRVVRTSFPDGTETTVQHDFGPDRSGINRLRTSVVDANGNEKKTFTETGGSVVAVQEFNQPPNKPAEVIWTSYGYNALGELTEVRDDKDGVTSLGYDNFGRRRFIANPDTGRTETTYDLASNVIATVTPNLRAESSAIQYDYHFGRLQSIRYPKFPANNVTYTYGPPGAEHNRAGRPFKVNDESGVEERFYGKLGEVTKEIKTIASDTQGRSASSPEVYTTQFVVDTFGRMQSLVHPDGEKVVYGYDAGGQVNHVRGEKGGRKYDYVRRVEYDKFTQRAFLETGNKVRTRYEYKPDNLRLDNLRTVKGDRELQDITFGFDKVGNVLSLVDDVPIPKDSKFGGPTRQTFEYDGLYRLTGAKGTYEHAPKKVDRYSLSIEYDTTHRIRSKNQTHEIVQPSGQVVGQQKTTYSWAYDYAGPQPHAPTHIGDRTFRYDAEGNQTGWDHDQNGTHRQVTWDEDGRVQAIADNGQEVTYKYDASGRRVIKRGPQGETAYVNSHFSIRNREVGTKHIFVGTSRIASKMLKQDKPGSNPSGDTPLEKDVYYFHVDHLGSSNQITDAKGNVYQHFQYFPYGQEWVAETSSTERTPYRFAGNELDEETGLYYIGARYYDPPTSIWQSPDPLLVRETGGAGRVGVPNPANLQLYSYAYQNPLRFTDPDGEAPTPWEVANIAMGVASVAANAAVGNYGDAAVDALGVILDTASLFTPIPGGAGTVIKTFRAADKVNDAYKTLKTVDRGVDAVDTAKDLTKASGSANAASKKFTNGKQFEALSSQNVSGTKRPQHRASANEGLLNDLEADPNLRKVFDDELGVDVVAHMRSGKGPLKNPPGTEWHHPTWDADSMLLLRKEVHRDPNLRPILHPGKNGRGGFAENY